MYFPSIKKNNGMAHGVSENFAGLNRSNLCSDNEFSEMKNCGNRHFPYASGRPSRKLIYSTDKTIESLYSPFELDDDEFKFSGIAGGKLYYRGSEKDVTLGSVFRLPYPYSDKSKYPELTRSVRNSVVPFTDEVYTFPSLKGFNVLGADLEGKSFRCNTCINAVFDSYETSDLSVSYSTVMWSGTSGSKFKFGKVSDIDIAVGDLVDIYYSTDVNINNCTFTSDNPNIIKALLHDTNNYINRIYTATVLEIYTDLNEYNVEFIDGFKLKLRDINGDNAYFMDETGKNVASKDLFENINLRISKHVPELCYSCEFAGRIFALDPYGKYIYASKLFEPMNFTCFDNRADSSWYTEVSSPGEWTGIISCGNYVYCFKKDIVYVLFGDNSTNFTIGKTFSPGCIDGRSICTYNNYLYYLSPSGFMCYSASLPMRIDMNLGDVRYKEAVCTSFDSNIYMAATTDEDVHELIVYDTEKNVFFIEDDLEIVDFVEYRNKLYAATKHEIYKFDAGCEDVEFSVTSKLFTDATSYLRSVVSLNFRMKFEPGSDATVYISYDDSDWQTCGFIINGKIYHTNSDLDIDGIREKVHSECSHNPNAVYVQRVPVRFRASNTYRYKIVCHGRVVIESIERNIAMAGQEMR